MTLSVAEKEVAFVPNPVPAVAVAGPQRADELVLCSRAHSLLPPTLQVVIEVISPPTVHLKVMVSSGQVGGTAVNCPATLSADN